MPLDELTCECTEKIMENSATACLYTTQQKFVSISQQCTTSPCTMQCKWGCALDYLNLFSPEWVGGGGKGEGGGVIVPFKMKRKSDGALFFSSSSFFHIRRER